MLACEQAGPARVDLRNGGGERVRLDAVVRTHRGAFTLEVGLVVEAGRTLALVGPNGAGKTTTVGVVSGIIPLDAGHIRVGDRAIGTMPTEQRRVGVVFQDYLLFPHLTVRQNIAFSPRATDPEAWLARLDLIQLADLRPAQLSGGQAQRVALARALAAEPDVLLLDEPLAALDVEVRDEVRAELAGHLAQFHGVTVVVTHSWDDVVALAADVVVLEGGRVTQRGTVDEVRARPATPYIRKLVR
jgi:molybdate transport system ATP-binding protein